MLRGAERRAERGWGLSKDREEMRGVGEVEEGVRSEAARRDGGELRWRGGS